MNVHQGEGSQEHESQVDELQQGQRKGAKRKPGCKCAEPGSTSWGDFDDDAECAACAACWSRRPRTRALQLSSIERSDCECIGNVAERGSDSFRINNHFCRSSFRGANWEWPRVSGGRVRLSDQSDVLHVSASMRADNWLSGGDLEAARPVPIVCGRTQFASRCMCDRRSRPSVGDIGRRRSVGSGSRQHCNVHAHVHRHAFLTHACGALPCFHARVNDGRRTVFSPLCVGSR